MSLSFETIRSALAAQPLFEDKSWQLSPQAWPLTPEQVAELEAIGTACVEFYQALETLYLRAATGKNLLRNKPLLAPWVAEYLDRGKPAALVEHGRDPRNRGALPPADGEYEVLGIKDGIKNWAVRYDAKLLRGGEFFNEQAARALADWGVKTVISIVPTDRERDLCRTNGLVLVEIPFNKPQGPSAADIRLFLDTIKSGAAPFYVHCVGGTHRGGVLGVAYRVHLQNWPYEKALVEFGRLGGELKENHQMLEAVRTFKP